MRQNLIPLYYSNQIEDMYSIIAIMFLGMGLGYLVRRWPIVRYLSVTTMLTILILLLLLGEEVGSNKLLMQNLLLLGGEALLIALAGVGGSILAAAAVYKYLYKGKRNGNVG
jgi:hypothetical protein